MKKHLSTLGDMELIEKHSHEDIFKVNYLRTHPVLVDSQDKGVKTAQSLNIAGFPINTNFSINAKNMLSPEQQQQKKAKRQ